jgi:membrane-bound hydrogenase subunit beta
MSQEETIKQALASKFPALTEKIRIQRPRRIWADAPRDAFRAVLEHAAGPLGFTHLCTITGLDEGETLAFIYHLARPDGVVLCLKTAVPKTAPAIKTVTDLYAGATSYERELVDMFGAQVEGLPPGKRYPLPDDWPTGQYPLRKDWKTEMLDKPQAAGKGEGAHG